MNHHSMCLIMLIVFTHIYNLVHNQISLYYTVGELNIGETCAPYTITRVRHGTRQVQEHIEGRKLPLLDIRRQALKDHYQFMRLQKKDAILEASREELEGFIGQEASQMSASELREYVATHIACCHFAV